MAAYVFKEERNKTLKWTSLTQSLSIPKLLNTHEFCYNFIFLNSSLLNSSIHSVLFTLFIYYFVTCSLFVAQQFSTICIIVLGHIVYTCSTHTVVVTENLSLVCIV